MTIYLTIITTVLVLTQITRALQNRHNIKQMNKLQEQNDKIEHNYQTITRAAEKYLKEA